MTTTAPASCAHTEHVPLEHVDPPIGQESAPVIHTIGRECIACRTALPPEWGCEDCSWLQVLLLVVARHTYVLTRRCRAHQEAA